MWGKTYGKDNPLLFKQDCDRNELNGCIIYKVALSTEFGAGNLLKWHSTRDGHIVIKQEDLPRWWTDRKSVHVSVVAQNFAGLESVYATSELAPMAIMTGDRNRCKISL